MTFVFCSLLELACVGFLSRTDNQSVTPAESEPPVGQMGADGGSGETADDQRALKVATIERSLDGAKSTGWRTSASIQDASSTLGLQTASYYGVDASSGFGGILQRQASGSITACQ